MADFLLEIGTDEIPARMLTSATEELARRITELLKREFIGVSNIESFSTPRRIAFRSWVAEKQPDSGGTELGPALSVAFKDGKPTKAAEGFAKKYSLTVNDLKITEEGEKRVYVEVHSPGRPTKEILAEQLPKEIA